MKVAEIRERHAEMGADCFQPKVKFAFIVLGVALALAGVAALFVPARANRASPTDGHEFDTMAVDPGVMSPAEAGLAIGEHVR